jgi:Spy/CpxP family protein refolding chaperone
MRLIAICTIIVGVTVGTCLANPILRAIHRDPEMAEASGITKDQIKEVGDLFESTERAIIESRAKLQIKRLELGRLERSDQPDMRQIRKLLDEMGDARSSAMIAKIERRIRTRQILTSDQMRKLREVMRPKREGRRSANCRHEHRSRRMLREHRGGRGKPMRHLRPSL